MPRKKKHPKLPNGYGSIRKLSGNRINPYAVHPPVTEYTDTGKPITPKALCYVSDWYVGFAVLTAYKSGTYHPGMEQELSDLHSGETGNNLDDFAKKIISYLKEPPVAEEPGKKTFAEVYEEFYNWKFCGKKQYSKSAKNASKAGFKNSSVIHDMSMVDITYDLMQEILDLCPLKHSSLEHIISCMKQTFKYALSKGYIEKNATELLRISIDDDDEHGVPFEEKDVKKLWDHETDDMAQMLLIMIYSGFRIGELKVITVDMEKMIFDGGIKTRTSRERTVPIHSKIQEIVRKRLKQHNCLMPRSYTYYSIRLEGYLATLGIEKHTSHDCRHTFSKLCEKYKVNDNDRRRMLGHKFKDITNRVYGHRDISDLRKEIEKIV